MNYSSFPPLSPEAAATATAIADRDFRGRLLVGDHILDLGALRLVSDPEVRVTRKAAAVMIYLARHQGRTISRNELLDHVWAGTCPTPEVVTQAVMELRRVLGDDGRANSVIETVPRLGYRLAVPAVFQESLPAALIRRVATPGDPPPSAPPTAMPPLPESSPEPLSPPMSAPHAARPRLAAVAAVPSNSAHHVRWLLLLIALLALIPKLVTLLEDRELALIENAAIGPTRILAGSTGAEFFPDLTADAASVMFSAPDRNSSDVFKIFEKGVHGSTPMRITSDAVGEELLPAVAPDGRQLAYVRMQEGHCEVRIMRIPGGANQRAFPCTINMPPYLEWSPDSSHLLSYAREPGNPGSVRLLEYRLADGALRWLNYARADTDVDVEPRYSPDGRSIAFRRGVRPASTLWLLNRETGALTSIMAAPRHLLGFDWMDQPPRLIAALRDDAETRLVIIGMDGRITPTQVTSAEFPRVRGDHVVFVRGEQRVGVATLTPLTQTAQRSFRALSVGHNHLATYAPDGAAIAYVSTRASDRRLNILARGSETPLQLDTIFQGEVRSLNWSPDGRHILLVIANDGLSQMHLADAQSGSMRALPANGVLTAAFDANADAIWFTAQQSGKNRLHRLLAPFSATPLIVATPVLANEVQTRFGTEGVFVLDRCIVRLDDALLAQHTYCPPPEHTAWLVGDDSIWTFRQTGMRNVSLHRYDLRTRTPAEVGEYPLWWADGGFDIAPGESELLYAAFNADESGYRHRLDQTKPMKAARSFIAAKP